MAFGNPYGEMWKWQDVEEWAQRFSDMGIKTVMLSDTTGVSGRRDNCSSIFQNSAFVSGYRIRSPFS